MTNHIRRRTEHDNESARQEGGNPSHCQFHMPRTHHTPEMIAATKRAGAPSRPPAWGAVVLLLRHFHDHLENLIRDAKWLTVALEYHDSLAQGCARSHRRVKLPRPNNEACQLAV